MTKYDGLQNSAKTEICIKKMDIKHKHRSSNAISFGIWVILAVTGKKTGMKMKSLKKKMNYLKRQN